MSTIIPGTERRIIVIDEEELKYMTLSVRAMNKFLEDWEGENVLEESSRQNLHKYLSTRMEIFVNR